MKKYISLLISIFIFLGAKAASPDEHLSFMGMPIAGSDELFVQHLIDKGFVKTGTFESTTSLYGKFANEIVELTVLASPRTKTVCKVIVYFPVKSSWSELKDDYFNKKRLYRSKYLMDKDFEFFSGDYEDGDGYEMRAVTNEKCNYCTFFNEPGGHITVEICPKKQVKVTYEDSINIQVAKQELEFDAYEDI